MCCAIRALPRSGRHCLKSGFTAGGEAVAPTACSRTPAFIMTMKPLPRSAAPRTSRPREWSVSPSPRDDISDRTGGWSVSPSPRWSVSPSPRGRAAHGPIGDVISGVREVISGVEMERSRCTVSSAGRGGSRPDVNCHGELPCGE